MRRRSRLWSLCLSAVALLIAATAARAWAQDAPLGPITPRAPQPTQEWAALAQWLDADLTRHNTASALALVEALEHHPIPDQSRRDALIECLVGVLSAHGQEALVARVLAVRAAPAGPDLSWRGTLSFPKDHGSHPAAVSEWWYFNGHLAGDGRHLGYELCFFKTIVGLDFVHVAITDEDAHTHEHARLFYKPLSIHAGRGKLALQYGPHAARELPDGSIALRTVVGRETLELKLRPLRAPMLVNGDGIIDMPEGLTSRYFSYTRLATTARLASAGKVSDLAGLSWWDHQWGTFICLLRPWDWFCFQMDDGSDYNIFHFRAAGQDPGRTDATLLTPDGRTVTTRDVSLSRESWWQSPLTHGWFVTRWRLALPALGTSFLVTATVDDQEMPRSSAMDLPPAYWEGSIRIATPASQPGRAGPVDRAGDANLERRDAPGTINGIGYSEHMPYARPEPFAP